MLIAYWEKTLSLVRFVVPYMRSSHEAQQHGAWPDGVALFLVGASSWTLVSGVFASAVWEIRSAPEGYALFSSIDVAVQVCNVAPAALVLLAPEGWVDANSEHLTCSLLGLGLATAAWLCLVGSRLQTASTSLGLLIGAAAAGLVGTTAMVCFFPYAATFRGRVSVAALSAGVGACGLAAQILAYAADGGERFGSREYFIGVGVVQLAGLLGQAWLRANAATAKCSEAPRLETEEHRGTLRGWAARHGRGLRSAGEYPLVGVSVTCVLNFAMPSLLPYLNPSVCDADALFWLTALWNGSSVLGRLAASYHPLQGYVVANATQAAILAGAVAAAARAAPPPTAVSLPLVCLSSVLHGLVVTSAFVAASNAGGTGYVGLANQVGALLGSLFALVLVRAGAIPDAGGPTC